MIFLRFVLALAFVAAQVEIRADEHCDVDGDENKACEGDSYTKRFTFTNMEEGKDKIREFMQEVLEKHQPKPCATKSQETTVTKETNMETTSITATMNYESTTAAHPISNEETSTATHPTMNNESTTASNPRKTGGTASSCRDVCLSSWMSNDAVVSGKLKNSRIVERRCRCRIIIQRRKHKNKISFARNLTEYQQGFGVWAKSYWLGLDRIHALTNRSGGVTMQIVTVNNRNETKMRLNARLDRIHALINRTGGETVEISARSIEGKWNIFTTSEVHIAAEPENCRLTMLDTNDEDMRQLDGSTFEVKNIEADACKDISGDPTDKKWCNPNGAYMGGIK